MLYLSHREVRSLGGFIGALSAPLAHADTTAWRQEVISRGQELLSVDRAVFGLEGDAANPVAEEGLDPATVPSYVEYYHRLDRALREQVHRRMPIAAYRHELMNGWPAVPEFRHEFLGHFRLDAGAGMAHHAGAACWCGFYPDTDAPERFEERAVQIFQIAYPAFRAGLDTLFRTRNLRADFARLLDRVPDGFLLADGRGTIVHRNTALQRILATDPGSCVLERALEVMVRRFAAGVSDAARAAEFFPTAPLVTADRSYDLSPTVPGGDLKQLGVALIVQVVRRAPPAPAGEVLCKRFGLTAREADVTRCLVQGLSYKRIAQQLGVSLDTVRSHIRSVYSKLQVHNVAEAVSFVLADRGTGYDG